MFSRRRGGDAGRWGSVTERPAASQRARRPQRMDACAGAFAVHLLET
ncbi:MAG: hypothetical protein ACK52I_12800 [Pseudomonadota bacterium]